MSTLLVTYRFVASPGQEQVIGLQAALKSGGGCARLTDGCYVMQTSETPETVYASLRRYVHKNDLLLVMRVSRPFFGQHTSDVVEWLGSRL